MSGKLWIQDGKLITSLGHAVLCGTCPCTGTGTGTGSIGTGSYWYCQFCTDDEMPDEVELVVGSPTMQSCMWCNTYARTYVLPRTGACTWGETWSNLGSNLCGFTSGPSLAVLPFQLQLYMSGIGEGGGTKAVSYPYDCKNMNETITVSDGLKCRWGGSVVVRAR